MVLQRSSPVVLVPEHIHMSATRDCMILCQILYGYTVAGERMRGTYVDPRDGNHVPIQPKPCFSGKLTCTNTGRRVSIQGPFQLGAVTPLVRHCGTQAGGSGHAAPPVAAITSTCGMSRHPFPSLAFASPIIPIFLRPNTVLDCLHE